MSIYDKVAYPTQVFVNEVGNFSGLLCGFTSMKMKTLESATYASIVDNGVPADDLITRGLDNQHGLTFSVLLKVDEAPPKQT